MSSQDGGLLAQIEAGVLDSSVPLSSLLQNVIVLGGKAGSEKMREWARHELNGYIDAIDVPRYRQLGAPGGSAARPPNSRVPPELFGLPARSCMLARWIHSQEQPQPVST